MNDTQYDSGDILWRRGAKVNFHVFSNWKILIKDHIPVSKVPLKVHIPII